MASHIIFFCLSIIGQGLNIFDLFIVDLLWWRNTKRVRLRKNARKGIVSKSEKAYRSVYQSLYYVSANCSDRRIYIDTFIGIDISKSQFDNFISIHTKQLVLGLTAF